ncbi:TPA: hypothetical protein ACH3X1_013144 [Trebouxia sp. C0004]
MPSLAELEFACGLASEIQHVSLFLNKQRLAHDNTIQAASSLSSKTVRHARSRLTSLDRKQVVIADRLEASSRREQMCHQQLELRAVSLSGRKRLAAALEAEKLLKAGYTNQLLLLKNTLQDILISLCQSLGSQNRPWAAAEANRLAEKARVLDLSSDKLRSDGLPNTSRTVGEQRHRQPLHSTQVHQTSQHSRSNTWSSTDWQGSRGCSNDRLAAEAASLQSCPDSSMTSAMSTSKASRYLQKRVIERPSALQQRQACAQRHSKDSDAAACNRDSLADSCSSMSGMSYTAVRQLLFASPTEATFGQSDATGAGGTQQVAARQAAEEGRASDDEQRVDMQLRQNMLRSHPVMDNRAASPGAQDTLRLEAGTGDRGGSGGMSQAISRSKSLPLSAHVLLGRSLQSSCSGLAGFNSSTLLQALQDSILQLEARASIAEAGKAAALRQLAQARQQLAADSRAHDAELAELAEQLAHQGVVSPGASHYIGPLESRANPVSPILSPRVHSTLHEAEQDL